MERMGLGGKPKPSRFSAKGVPSDDDAARVRMAAAARAARRAEHEVFDEGEEYFPTAPPGRFYRRPPRIDRPVAWAALFLGILVFVLVAVGAFVYALKRWI